MTLSVLPDVFSADVTAERLVDAVRGLSLGELLVVLSVAPSGVVHELSDPEVLVSAAAEVVAVLGLAEIRKRGRAEWPWREDFTDLDQDHTALMLACGGPDEFFRLTSIARRIRLAAGLLPL